MILLYIYIYAKLFDTGDVRLFDIYEPRSSDIYTHRFRQFAKNEQNRFGDFVSRSRDEIVTEASIQDVPNTLDGFVMRGGGSPCFE